MTSTPALQSAWNFPSSLRDRRNRLQLGFRECGNLNRSLKLSASGINIAASRTPQKRWNAPISQNLLKLHHLIVTRSLEVNTRPRVKRDQIHLAAQATQ